jgi:hypothetical protein
VSNATLVVQEGGYHCPECLRPIVFETAATPEEERCLGNQLDKQGFAIGKCNTTRCDRYGVRVKVRLRTIEVEELPPQHEENPRGTQTESRVNGTSGRR